MENLNEVDIPEKLEKDLEKSYEKMKLEAEEEKKKLTETEQKTWQDTI